MLNKKILIPLVILTSAVFAIGYGITNNFEPIKILFDSNVMPDSGDNPPVSVKDISGMFNERGFMLSNSVSYDGNELINDFNGNLMYELPMYNLKGKGEINADMKLTYNGSVAHQFILSTPGTIGNTNPPQKYNITSPEWIIGLNGFAIQVMNFETDMLTQPSNGNSVSGNYVKKLIPGYHFNDKCNTIDGQERDKVMILLADGSNMVFVNKSGDPGGNDESSFIGEYYCDSKGSHVKATLSYTDFGSLYSYRNRRMEVMMGDGLLYIFNEFKPLYYDMSSATDVRKPQIMLLESIRSRLGDSIIITYDKYNTNLKGRPRWTGVTVGKQFAGPEYTTLGNGIIIYNSIFGNYKIMFQESVFYGTGGNKTAMISRFTNPLLQQTKIEYQGYQRKLTNIPCNIAGFNSQTILCNDLNRIQKFTSYLKAVHTYQYIDANDFCSGGVCMQINYAENTALASNYHKGYGRDPFYVNMINQKNDYENTTEKTQTSYDYGFTNIGESFSTKPIDTSDIYYNTSSVISKDANTVYNSDPLSKGKLYRIYPVKEYGNVYNPENLDLTGVTKLVGESLKNENGNNVDSTIYIFDQGTVSGVQYLGSFELLAKINLRINASRRWDYIYEFKASSSGGNKFDSIITEKTEVDPMGYKTQTIYKNFDEPANFLKGIPISGTFSGTPAYNRPPVWASRLFYKIGLPETVRRFDNNANRYARPEYNSTSDVLLKQQTFTYITDTTNSPGYLGQLLSERNFAQGSTSISIETAKYEYYRNDTTGRYLYKSDGFPFVEGNLKLKVMPNGQEEKYYYYLYSKSDTIGEGEGDSEQYIYPRAYYKLKYNTGNIVYEWDNFTDTRSPIKIEKIHRINSNTLDTLFTQFIKYDDYGNPVKYIDNYGFVSKIDYQFPMLRVKAITLPGDFSTTASYIDTTYRYDTNYANVLVPSNGWGKLDYFDNDKISFLTQSNRVNCGAPEPYFNTEYTAYINPPAPQYQKIAAIRFEYDKLGYFASIDSAMLFIAPYRNWVIVNGIKYFDKHTNEVYGIYDRTMVSSTNCGSDAYVQTYTPQLHSQAAYININAYDSSLNCEAFYPQKHNIKLLLNSMKSANRNTLWGIVFKPKVTDMNLMESFPQRFELDFTSCGNGTTFNHYLWSAMYAPKLNIYGNYLTIDTVRTPVIFGGTYIYYYDDAAKTVSVHSRLTHSPNKLKKIKYHFDGFGNIKEKDVYTSSTNYDDFRFAFNFMNQPAENIDARNNSTKLSYDYLGRLKKTLNADNSYSTSGFAYQSSLSDYFTGSYSGFVEKQTFTDETNREFVKYFDAVGNLLREEKYVAPSSGNPLIPAYDDSPYDPDTTFGGQDVPQNWLTLRTDYKYDNLYRLIEVKTPGGKTITYNYDAYGRQSLRNTPDAGITRYSLDNNGNLILSQDANQKSKNSLLNTRRTYDGLNRLLTISDYTVNSGNPVHEGPMGDTLLPFEFDTPPGTDSIYIVNVYDTLSTAVVSIFSSPPSDYNTSPNYTRGNLVATAYRTVLGEDWGYKFYRYDERGNVVKLWHYIVGLGWKTELYYHNSQSQLTRNWYQPNQGDGKLFTYGYDDAGRLDYVNQYVGAQPEDPEEESDSPTAYFTLTKYTYNENSQVLNHFLNSNTLSHKYTYNNRNWVTRYNIDPAGNAIFLYDLQYDTNGNIRRSVYGGSYKSNFTNTANLYFKYIYDNSNRLLKTQNDDGSSSSTFNLINGYDKDGNFQGMKRYGSANNLADDFGYSYFSGTNKLQTVSQGMTAYNYTYDANGNMLSDQLNRTGSIKYDHRNLMTEIRVIKTKPNPDPFGPPTIDVLYLTKYRYDEVGNRIRKTRWEYTGSDPDPVFDLTGDTPPWTLQSDEFYIRDVSGKEIAIYTGSSLTQWNIWGLDNIGKINADTTRNYYLKDHLGSVRVVLNSVNSVVSAQDYDAWGYPLENRTYQFNYIKYSFITSELDNESNYTHFGFRKYDSKIGRFTSVEPIISSSYSWSTYVYSGDNPITIIDPNGTRWYYNHETKDYEWDDRNEKEMWNGKYNDKGEKVFEKVQGLEELLFYTGKDMHWLKKSGEREAWKAISGIPDSEGNTQPDNQNQKDKGPIPEGTYSVNPNDTKSFWTEINPLQKPIWLKNFKPLGLAYTPIKPIGGTNTYDRGGFFIHGGLSYGSIGCIDLTSPANETFHAEFMDYGKELLLIVNYTGIK